MERSFSKNVSPLIALAMGLSACATNPKTKDAPVKRFEPSAQKIQQSAPPKDISPPRRKLAELMLKKRPATLQVSFANEQKVSKEGRKIIITLSKQDALNPDLKPVLDKAIKEVRRHYKGQLSLVPQIIFKEMPGGLRASFLFSIQRNGEKTKPMKFKLLSFHGSWQLSLAKRYPSVKNLPPKERQSIESYLADLYLRLKSV